MADAVRKITSGERIEIILTVICLVTLLFGFLGSMSGVISPGLARFFYILSYLSGGYFGTIQSGKALFRGELNVDILMILAAAGAAVLDNWIEGAVLLFLFSLSNTLEHYAMERNRREIEAIMKLRPDSALVRRPDGSEEQVPVDSLSPGDLIVVKPGERLPIDGVIQSGAGSVNQSAITGESVPVSKEVGDEVFAATLNEDGVLTVKVTKHANETTLAKIIRMVEQARSTRARTQRFLDNFESPYAVGVILFVIGLIVVPYYVLGQPFDPVFYRAMTILVVASPCALIISTPASILSAIANAARNGILFKGGVHLEEASRISSVAFDKTGTLTTGQSEVTDIVVTEYGRQEIGSASGIGNGGQGDEGRRDLAPVAGNAGVENSLLAFAASAEEHSEHHLAAALLREASRRGISLTRATHVQTQAGKGITAHVNGSVINVGNRKLLGDSGDVGDESFKKRLKELEDEGKTIIFVSKDNRLTGAIALADQVRPGAAEALNRLRRIGISRFVILTGDTEQVARKVGRELGIEDVYAGLLPDEKVAKIKKLSAVEPIIMVGDGVNDAPALVASNLGVAMGAVGTDVALETADVVLMSDELSKIPYMIDLSRRSRRVVWQNIGFSLAVIALLVTSVFLFELPLPLGVVAHEGSTLLVVLNGLRLLNRG